jgi:Pyruvate/2-oxoacid:ferredoxin oxidoreductase delta subunit
MDKWIEEEIRWIRNNVSNTKVLDCKTCWVLCTGACEKEEEKKDE